MSLGPCFIMFAFGASDATQNQNNMSDPSNVNSKRVYLNFPLQEEIDFCGRFQTKRMEICAFICILDNVSG